MRQDPLIYPLSFDETAGAAPRYAPALKRAFDLALAMVLAPIFAPLIAVLWLATRLDGGPGFFGHVRVGKDGREFRCWKIRTMLPDAEARLKRHLSSDPAAAREWARTRKLAADPRVTRLGDVLRRTSLDELPQIWNVLRGDMSFVGPRPVVGDELDNYGGLAWAYLAQRPGVTGLWQVSGRNAVGYARRVQLDLAYLRTATLWLDLEIVARTAVAMLRRTGI